MSLTRKRGWKMIKKLICLLWGHSPKLRACSIRIRSGHVSKAVTYFMCPRCSRPSPKDTLEKFYGNVKEK